MNKTNSTTEPTGATFQSELAVLLSGTAAEQEAAQIFAMGKEVVIFVILTLIAQYDKANSANAQGLPSPAEMTASH